MLDLLYFEQKNTMGTWWTEFKKRELNRQNKYPKKYLHCVAKAINIAPFPTPSETQGQFILYTGSSPYI